MRIPFVLSLLLSCMFCAATYAEKPAADKKLDFGDRSSQTLTTKAWSSMHAKKYEEASVFALACIKEHQKRAMEIQNSLKEPIDASDKAAVMSKGALNDVGTCYFILGRALEEQGKKADAVKAYKQLIKSVSFAQCWDPQGWFWKPAELAAKQIKLIESEASDGTDITK